MSLGWWQFTILSCHDGPPPPLDFLARRCPPTLNTHVYTYVRCTSSSLTLSTSSAPNIYWFNHQPGLLRRPLCSKLKKKGGGGGGCKRTWRRTRHGLNLWLRLSHQADGAISADNENVQHISLAHENIQTASRWSFCGDPRVNNGIKKGYFPTVPDSCTMVCKTAPKFVPLQKSSKMSNPLTQPSLHRFLDEGTYTDGLKCLLLVGQNWNKGVFI